MGGTRYVDEGPAISATALHVEPHEDRLIGEPSPDQGPYRVVRRVGSGGMGSVFLAYHREWTGVNGIVAVKRLHPHLLDDAQYVDMFFDEAEIASRINHPNVARVFDYGMLAGAPYLAMELLQGKQLSDVRRALRADTCPLTREERIAFVGRIVADAAAGLHAAHELRDERGELLNVVHRDVSPQNIFVTFDGISKIVDFGTVKAKLQQHRTRTGFFKGKCAYIAPDNLLGKRVDRRVDVWSLGVVLWELLTNERLFAGQTDAQTLRAVLEQDVPNPCAIDRDLPARVAEVALRALQRDPDERYSSARLFAAELEEATGGFAGVSSAAVSGWLELLYPGERDLALAESARLARGELSSPREEETRLWLEVDDEPTGDEAPTSDPGWAAAFEVPRAPSSRPAARPSRPSAPPPTGSTEERGERDDTASMSTPTAATTTLPTRPSSADGSRDRALQLWRMATLGLVAALAGVGASRLLPPEPAAGPPLPPPALAPAVGRGVATPTTFELWEIGVEGRRLLWRGGTPSASLPAAPQVGSDAEPGVDPLATLPPEGQDVALEATGPTVVASPRPPALVTAPSRQAPAAEVRTHATRAPEPLAPSGDGPDALKPYRRE